MRDPSSFGIGEVVRVVDFVVLLDVEVARLVAFARRDLVCLFELGPSVLSGALCRLEPAVAFGVIAAGLL